MTLKVITKRLIIARFQQGSTDKIFLYMSQMIIVIRVNKQPDFIVKEDCFISLTYNT